MVFIQKIKNGNNVRELLFRNFAVAVRVEKLRQRLSEARTVDHHPFATRSGKSRSHRIPLFLIDEAVLVGIKTIKRLRWKLAGELVLAELFVFVLVKLCKVRHLKLHPHLASAESAAGRRHRRRVLSERGSSRETN